MSYPTEYPKTIGAIDEAAERSEVKIIMCDMLDNFDQRTTEKEKLDYLINCLSVSALMLRRQFGTDITLLQLNQLSESIADQHVFEHIKNKSL